MRAVTGTVRSITAALAAAALVALAACASPGGGPDASSPPPSPTAASPSEPSPTRSEPIAPAVAVAVYFAHPQPTRVTLIDEPHLVLVDAGATTLDATLGGIIDGSLQPVDPDYENLWGGGSRLLSTSHDADTLVIDLAPGTLSLGAESEGVALAQLVWTATAIDQGIVDVRVTIDGAPAETLAGHVDLTQPLTRGAPESILSPVHVVTPAENASVMSPVVASGVACVFEAAFVWRLEDADGVVLDGSGMADEACPARAPWTLELGELPAGDYVLTVIELSAADGAEVSLDSRAFTVAG